MKTTINKTAKRVLSAILAFVMILGTLFVANVGVTFNADAASVEDTWDGTKVKPTTTDSEGNIIINNAEELAWIALQGGSATQGKSYKVVDNAVFNMNGMEGITLASTSAEVKAATKNNSYRWLNDSNFFMGNFDGNGLIVYNINGSGGASFAYSGLFTITKASTDNASTDMLVFKNVTVMASYFTGFHGVGGIIGQADAPGTGTKLTVENCAVKNCYLYNDSTGGNRNVGGIVGTLTHNATTINNCFVSNNDISSTGTYGAFFANTSNYGNNPIVSNSIVVGTTPVPTKVGTDFGSKVANTTYSNIYTDQTVSKTGVTKLTVAQMTGEAATQNMALDFSGAWFANTSGTPVLRKFHNITAKNNGDTHSEVCDDCDLVGIASKHYYNDVDYTGNTTSCVCGAFVFGVYDVWDGTKASAFESGSGTEADPYIIKTVEQLFLMVRSTGINAEGNQIYYKVSDDVNALYINDTRGFADQATFEAAAASGMLKNWSTGLITEAQYCANKTAETGVACSAGRHLSACIDYFAGKFDGNGVTIYGLYSYDKNFAYYAPGVGFVPALTDGAVIKNVIFDTNYVQSGGGYAAVVTSGMGSYFDGQYNQGKCEHVLAYAKEASRDSVANITNVVVRNSYIETSDCPLTSGTQSFASGLVSSCFFPKDFNIANCLFDGTNSTFKLNGSVSLTNESAIITTRTSTQYVRVNNCINVQGKNTPSNIMFYPTHAGTYECLFDSYTASADELTVENLPMFNWSVWDINAVAEYGTPMPKETSSWIADSYLYDSGSYITTYKQLVTTDEIVYDGYNWGALRSNEGIFNAYNTLEGSGTEEDPYIIYDAITLYRIIASGGTHFDVPLYYQLGCNIDLQGMQWIDTQLFKNHDYNVTFYQYLPFEGVIDGNGYTISNLYSATDDDMGAGFVPYLSGGIIKNINFKNAYVASSGSYAGVIVGQFDADNGGLIENCSVENGVCIFDDTSSAVGCFVGYHDDMGNVECGNVVECYSKNDNQFMYYKNLEDATTTPKSASYIKEQLIAGNTEYTQKWYYCIGDDNVPHLIENATKQPCADIDGDGIGDEYTARDAVVLKNYLLHKNGYEYIYGDVSGNGKIDMRDLAALYRDMSGGEINEYDGFWPNVKAGKFSIYYDENDNYDFARRLELYLEKMSGLDIYKSQGSSDAKFVILLKTDSSMGAENYSSSYDIDNARLTIKGGSFTAVEEAVDKIIAETDAFGLPSQFEGSVSSEKKSTTVDGKTYYYAWGDEFNSDVAGTVEYDKWVLRNKGTDKTPKDVDSDFEGIREATNAEALLINQVNNGKLTLKRGLLTNDPEGYKYYMSGISSIDSMLFKQGYLEMKAIIPSDGAAFPAWWLLTHINGRGNDTVDDSLYSKVLELNGAYDGISRVPTCTNVQSFKYKLPTQTLEMDLFEIIQRPTVSYWSASKSKDHNIKFNVHKWYTYSLEKNDNSLAVYDLDWSKNLTSGAFPTKILTAGGATNGEGYTQQSATIKVNTENLKSASLNGAATYQGLVNGGTSSKPTPMQYDMANYRNSAGQITERKYGFLWTENTMKFIVYKDATSNEILDSFTVDASKMNFGGDEKYYTGDNYGFEQYAYMLIENHIFTSTYHSTYGRKVLSGIGACDLVIDYVRLYQLDNARDIVTPETEAFNSNERFN